MKLIDRVTRRLRGELAPPLDFPCRDHLTTRVFTLDDEPFQPSSRLLALSLEAAREAEQVSLAALAARPEAQQAGTSAWLTQWPGEHYRLLAGLARVLKPRCIVEIGTFTGWSALAMKEFLPAKGHIETFDIAAWNTFDRTGLRTEDFADGRLRQHVDDLADPAMVARHRDLLISADLVFLDGPHDGATEVKMLANFQSVPFANNPIFVFDDIKMPSLLKFWRDLPLPKLDFTSFGHWSGTGLAEWKSAPEVRQD